MNKSPTGWPTSTAQPWNSWGNNLFTPRVIGHPRGTKRNASPAEEILEGALGYWDANDYRAGDSWLRNNGTARGALDLQLGENFTQTTTTNAPTYLVPENETYFFQRASSGTTVTTPDSTALSVTTGFDVMIRMKPTAWSSGSDRALFAKTGSYAATIFANGNWVVTATDGTTNRVLSTSTNPVNIFDPTKIYWARWTLTSNNGANGCSAKFYYADDSVDIPTIWTQIGTTQTSATVGAFTIADTTNELSLISSAGTAVQGNYYRIVLRDGYDGAGNIVLDADFTTLTSPSQASFTESSSNGATITFTRIENASAAIMLSRQLGGVPLFLIGTNSDVFQQPALGFGNPLRNQVIDRLTNYSEGNELTVLIVCRVWGAPGGAGLMFKGSPAAGVPGWWLGRGASGSFGMGIQSDSGDGISQSSVSTTGIAGQKIVYGFKMTRDGYFNSFSSRLTASGTITRGVTAYLFNTANFQGRFDNSNTLYIGRSSVGMEFYAAAIFNRALTDDEILSIAKHYNATSI